MIISRIGQSGIGKAQLQGRLHWRVRKKSTRLGNNLENKSVLKAVLKVRNKKKNADGTFTSRSESRSHGSGMGFDKCTFGEDKRCRYSKLRSTYPAYDLKLVSMMAGSRRLDSENPQLMTDFYPGVQQYARICATCRSQ
jgi:hypothetical protein